MRSLIVITALIGQAHGFLLPSFRPSPSSASSVASAASALSSPLHSSRHHTRRETIQASSISNDQQWDMETDVVIIGSGIGGLSCGALLTRYGVDVRVFESHSIPGGAAHGFMRDGFNFDSGPSLWNGLSSPPLSPLGEILAVIGEKDNLKCAKYDGWGMYVPEGSFKFTVGPTKMEEVVEKFGGSSAVEEWKELTKTLEPIVKISTAMSPLALRADIWAIFTVGRYLPSLIKAGFTPAVTGDILSVAKKVVKNEFIINWLEFLSFAISGLPADSTIAAAMAYTLRDLHRPGAVLDYPMGGSEAVVAALVRGLNKGSKESKLTLNSHINKIIVEKGRAVGVELGKGKRVRAKKAVVSNASVWDTLKLLPGDAINEKARKKFTSTPMTDSFMHLHLGIDATGLSKDLDCHHTIVNTWRNISEPQNMAIISIPTTLDPSLAPPGHHVVHCYAAANEPYNIWEGMSRNSPEYKAFKKERAEFLWQALERVIPDVRQRVKVEMIASPLTHERFLRRSYGTYGPAWRAGKESFPGPKLIPIKNLLHCGDSTFPGIGVPAAAASGANAASSLVPFWKHWKLITDLKALTTNN